jgi:molecular chaperone GrpE
MIQPDPTPAETSAQPATQPAPTVELESCITQLAQARHEADDLRNRYVRAIADIENARKQAERDATARLLQDKRRFLGDFLEVADSLERALAVPGDPYGLYEGVEVALRQLQQVLTRAGVTRMAVRAGDPFTPLYHEAIEARPGDVERDTVADVVRAGYMHEGIVLRPAQVIVVRGRQ